MKAKDLIKNLFNAAGIEIKRFEPHATQSFLFKKIIDTHNIDFILDVGANAGQFAERIRKYGYTGEILSFEPLSQPWKTLQQKSATDLKWKVARRVALGDHNGQANINIAANSESSSILGMHKLHLEAAPESQYIGSEPVEIITLDDYLQSSGTAISKNTYLKIDTQGFEGAVLKGASKTLKDVISVELELSMAPLYEGQLLYKDIIELIESNGFALFSIFPEFIDPASGRLLQFVGVFLNESIINVKN